MTTITIDECIYNIHPVYDLYASDENGKIIHIIKKVPNKGNKNNKGYMNCSVRKNGESSQKSYGTHRFVWECFNGSIPEGKVITHINNNKEDNRLCNLQLMTQQENCNKSAKDRDYTFASKNCENRRCVKATNKNTNEVTYFKSMYAVQQHIGINVGIVKMVCEGLNNCKSGISKKDGHSYTFEYIKEDDLPNDHKKSANIRPKKIPEDHEKKAKKLSDEEKKIKANESMKKWSKKEWICSNCNKTFKNGNKYAHNKKCNSHK